MKKTFAVLGNPILRKRAIEVAEIKSNETQELIKEMISITAENKGLGLAAPQIFSSERIFVMANVKKFQEPNSADQDVGFTYDAVINPKVLKYSKKKSKDWEGCFSIPNLMGKISRSDSIDVEYTDLNGSIIKTTLQNLQARVFQHEFDHLEGVMFVDRLEDKNDLMMKDEFLERIHNQK